MSVLDGLTEIQKGVNPVGINPTPGTIFTWYEKLGTDIVVRYKDENGVVGNVGSSGSVETFRWFLQAGFSNLPATGVESDFTYGNSNAGGGVTMLRDGAIGGMTVRLQNPRVSGSATFILTINGVENNVIGQRVVIDGITNSEGGISSSLGYLDFPVNINYSAGDQIEIRTVTASFSPITIDGNVLVYMEEAL